MRKTLAVAATALVLAGCSSSGGSSSSGSATASAAVEQTASATAASGAFALVSQNLAKEGPQVILDAAAVDTTVVASVLSQTSANDYDAGLVFSTDAGSTWKWGGIVADPGKTFPEAIAATADGAMIVGTTDVTSAAGTRSQAFIAAAPAPDFQPEQRPVPKEFAGANVHLQDIAVISGTWIVVGWDQGAVDASGNSSRTSYMWRSSDNGATWTRQKMVIPGSTDNSLEQIVFGPDGSWNLVGQAVFGDGSNQYDPVWLRSEDAGATFQLTGQDALTAPFDQGATRISFAGDGSAAILGWDEVTDGSGTRSSGLWVSGPNRKLARVGGPEVPVSGGTPPGEFIDGMMWDGRTLTAWGSATGSYPMDNVQFWGLTKDGLVQSSMLPGNGTPLAVSKILVEPDHALAFGFTGKDLASSDVAIWKGTAAG
jgi:hypothetical protein